MSFDKPLIKEPVVNRNGITIAEFKRIINQLPDLDRNGDDRTIWVETGDFLSSPVREVWPLNRDPESCDILLKISLGDSVWREIYD